MFDLLPQLHVLRHVDLAAAVVLGDDDVAAGAEQPVVLVLLDAELDQPVVLEEGAQCFEPGVAVLALALSAGKGTLERFCRHYLSSGVMKLRILR